MQLMKEFGLSLAIALGAALTTLAAPGDQWILGVHHIDNQGDKPFTTYAGAGYSGPQSSGNTQYVGNSYGYASAGAVGVNRVWWELSGNSIVGGQPVGEPVSTTPQLYKIELFGTTDAGHNIDYQPVEVAFHGIVTDQTIDPDIPWAGAFGTNHQWMESTGADDATWHELGPGPQAPESDDYNTGPFGSYVWLKAGSWLYAKWDFPWAVDRTWSALRLTQVTPFPTGPVTGDYNSNGVVDAADYVLWRRTQSDLFLGAGYAADGNEDGYVDDQDYDLWRAAFGNGGHGSGSGLSPSNSVPEPASLWSVAVVGLMFCVFFLPRRVSIRHSFDTFR
jgi:hypothetical protein